jgi:hypothetical protein
MALKQSSLYRMIVFLFGAGYAWLGYHFFKADDHAGMTICLFKNVTGIPCPSCGVTRSLLLFARGSFLKAIWINPLGLLVGVLMIVIPIWAATDYVRDKITLAQAYDSLSGLLQRHKLLYTAIIALGLLNWGWNIVKDL